jgi:hypothetical protein
LFNRPRSVSVVVPWRRQQPYSNNPTNPTDPANPGDPPNPNNTTKPTYPANPANLDNRNTSIHPANTYPCRVRAEAEKEAIRLLEVTL